MKIKYIFITSWSNFEQGKNLHLISKISMYDIFLYPLCHQLVIKFHYNHSSELNPIINYGQLRTMKIGENFRLKPRGNNSNGFIVEM